MILAKIGWKITFFNIKGIFLKKCIVRFFQELCSVFSAMEHDIVAKFGTNTAKGVSYNFKEPLAILKICGCGD